MVEDTARRRAHRGLCLRRIALQKENMPGIPYAIDPERIVDSVFKEFGLSGTVSASPDPDDRDLYHLKIRYPTSSDDIHVTLFCALGATPVSVRERLKRQLELEP